MGSGGRWLLDMADAPRLTGEVLRIAYPVLGQCAGAGLAAGLRQQADREGALPAEPRHPQPELAAARHGPAQIRRHPLQADGPGGGFLVAGLVDHGEIDLSSRRRETCETQSGQEVHVRGKFPVVQGIDHDIDGDITALVAEEFGQAGYGCGVLAPAGRDPVIKLAAVGMEGHEVPRHAESYELFQ